MRAMFCLPLVAFTLTAAASAPPVRPARLRAPVPAVARPTIDDLGSWLDRESLIAEGRMAMNISPTGSVPGLILASPSKTEPNYFYSWVRDGAMVMRSILELSESKAGVLDSVDTLKDYVAFSRESQLKAGANLGEPRFNVDGTLNTEPWGRPQNDGPALRVLVLTRFAFDMLDRGDSVLVTNELYSAAMPAETVIKADLEYISHHWREKCVDLWEELWGQHFFTRATELAALREGAKLAIRMNDPGAASFYLGEADALELELNKHWSASRGYYLSTLDANAGPDHQKPTNLDTSVILAALATEQTAGILSASDGRILATATALENAFTELYPLNKDASVGAAIGRYTEDVYFGGNPWVLTTAAFAELNFRFAMNLKNSPSFALTAEQADYLTLAFQAFSKERPHLTVGFDFASDPRLRLAAVKVLTDKGDSFLRRLRRHVNPDGSFSEQFRADNGFMLSAYDLSWSYAGFLRAVGARKKLAL